MFIVSYTQNLIPAIPSSGRGIRAAAAHQQVAAPRRGERPAGPEAAGRSQPPLICLNERHWGGLAVPRYLVKTKTGVLRD